MLKLKPVRIVSLCPSITESLIALGLEEQIVGITRFCIHPAASVAKLRKLGGTKDPKLEAIFELQPDLVFMNAEENRQEDHEALAAELEVDVSMPQRVTEVAEHLRHLGCRTSQPNRGEALAARVEKALDALKQERLRLGLEETPGDEQGVFRTAYLIWKDPFMTVNSDTYVHDLLRWAGATNAFANHALRYPEVSAVEIQAAALDVLLLPDEPFPFAEKHRPELTRAFPDLPLELVSGDDYCWHGIRTERGLRAARALLAAQAGNRT